MILWYQQSNGKGHEILYMTRKETVEVRVTFKISQGISEI